MKKEALKISGHLKAVKRNVKTGKEKVLIDKKNLVMVIGKEWVASKMSGAGDNMSHMQLGGSNALPADDTLTALQGFLVENGNTAPANGSVLGADITFTNTFVDESLGGYTGNISEYGLFNGPEVSATVMLARNTHDPSYKGPDDEIIVTWTFTIA